MGTHVLPGPTFLYFFLCGYIRDQVYDLPLLVMLKNLQHRIKNTVRYVNGKMLDSVTLTCAKSQRADWTSLVYQNTFQSYLPSAVSSISAHCFHKINVRNHSDHLCSLSVYHTHTHTCRPYLFIQLHMIYFVMLWYLSQSVSLVWYNDEQVINLKECKRKWLWPTLRYYPGICLKGLRKTMTNVSGYSMLQPRFKLDTSRTLTEAARIIICSPN